MNPVDSVAAIAAAHQTQAVNPVAPPLQVIAQSQHAGTPDMQELTQRFREMMDKPQPAEHAEHRPQDSMLTHIMSNGEEFLKQTHERVAELRNQAPYMSPSEFIAASIEVSEAASIGNFRLQAATSVASGTNKSVQSLLKNQ
jgi:type III secretion inner rod protein HrpB2